MIAITRTASIAPGKLRAAMDFALQIAKYIKDNHGTSLEVLMPIGGNPNRIAWHARYDTVAQWEALTAKLLNDREYLEIIGRNSETFMAGSVRDEIWRTV
jgi:hypothetical protein